jgi:hypothetical protein
MKFLLLSRHTGGREVPENEREQNVKDLMEWWSLLKASTALPVSGGKSVTLESTEEYKGEVEGLLVFEAESLALPVLSSQITFFAKAGLYTKIGLSLIFRAKLRQIGQGRDGVTDQIQPVHRIGV